MSNMTSNNIEIITTVSIVEENMNILDPAVQRMVKRVENVAKPIILNRRANQER